MIRRFRHAARVGTIVAAVTVIATTTTLTAAPSAAAPASDGEVIESVVTVITDINAVVQLERDGGEPQSRSARITTTCLGVAIAPNRVITSPSCVEADSLSVRNRLREAAIEQLQLTTSAGERLLEQAISEQWPVTSPDSGILLTPTHRVRQPRAIGSGRSIVVRVVEHAADERVAILEGAAPLAAGVAALGATPPAVGSRVRVGTLRVSRGPTTQGPLEPRTVRSSNGRILRVDTRSGDEPGTPIFDESGGLAGLAVSEFSLPALGAASLRWILDAASDPTPTPKRSASNTSPTPGLLPERQAADDVAATADGRPDESTDGLSTWAMVAIGFGIVDVAVLAFILVGARRRRTTTPAPRIQRDNPEW